MRTYNSLLWNQSDTTYGCGYLGQGWTHNYNTNVTTLEYGDVLLKQVCGSEHLFVKSLGDWYVTPPGLSERLTKDYVTGNYILWSLDGSRKCYDGSLGRLINITNKNGDVLHLTYNDDTYPFDGTLGSVHDDSGIYMNFTYFGFTGRISSVTCPGGAVSYAYGQNGLINAFSVGAFDIYYGYYPHPNPEITYRVGPLKSERV